MERLAREDVVDEKPERYDHAAEDSGDYTLARHIHPRLQQVFGEHRLTEEEVREHRAGRHQVPLSLFRAEGWGLARAYEW
jgi:hypothetical protein